MQSPKKTGNVKSANKRTGSLQKKAARDPYQGPSSRHIEESLQKGKKRPLDEFRGMIDWSS